MEFASLDANLDDREEGEIVDDDFEDISDNSIIVPIFSGKSVSPNEHLPAISLSSVTEVDEPKSETKTRHRHKIPRKKCSKVKKRRNRKLTCSDSDSDDYLELDRKLQEQLKAAIRVDDTEERHKNSLRSRLKGMTKLDESDSGVEKNDNDNEEKLQDKNSSDEGDSELAELRLEALRTAVLNKFMHRKKRKVKESNENDVLSDTSIKTDNSETNKENNVTENCAKKACLEIPVQNGDKKSENATNIVADLTPPEEDEDVLRALLLASMSKKITSETEKKKTIAPVTNNVLKKTIVVEKKKETTNIIVNKVTNFNNRTTKNNIANKKLDLPEVKPLIINVNEDSDSEDELANKTVKNTNEQIITKQRTDVEIQNSVEKFLKEQRAKVEAQLSPIPKLPVKPISSSNPLDKSSLNYLPKVKQMEYRELVLKIKNAELKPRLKRLAQVPNSGNKPVTNTAKRIVSVKPSVAEQAPPVPKVGPAVDVKAELRTLQKIFKEIQVKRNGRLQIQEKYRALRPVIKKINEASVERRKWEEEVKRLLQEIADKKKKLVKSQEDFSAQINSLIQEKERIDKSGNLKGCELVSDSKVPFTSTPVKENPPVNFETSSILITIPNSTLPLSEKVVEPVPESQKVEDVLDAPLNPGDPNDIDIIYSKQKNTFPKYISPLDSVKRCCIGASSADKLLILASVCHRVVVDDPFSIVCPYDVDGNCRDPECIYKHFTQVK